MKFCRHCGKEIMDEAVICPNCGCGTEKAGIAPDDAPSGGMAVLGFFFPLIGLIIYLVIKDNKPKKAKSAGKGALIGFIVSVVLGIVSGIIAATAVNNAINMLY